MDELSGWPDGHKGFYISFIYRMYLDDWGQDYEILGLFCMGWRFPAGDGTGRAHMCWVL